MILKSDPRVLPVLKYLCVETCRPSPNPINKIWINKTVYVAMKHVCRARGGMGILRPRSLTLYHFVPHFTSACSAPYGKYQREPLENGVNAGGRREGRWWVGSMSHLRLPSRRLATDPTRSEGGSFGEFTRSTRRRVARA